MSTRPISSNDLQQTPLSSEALEISEQRSSVEQRIEQAADRSFFSIITEAMTSTTQFAQRSVEYVGSWFSSIETSSSRAQPAQAACIGEKAYQQIAIASHFASLAYKLCPEVTSLEYDDKSWSVYFLGRLTGNSIPSQPAAFLQSHSEERKTTYICIPGTISANDWISNMNAPFEDLKNSDFRKDLDDHLEFFSQSYTVHSGFLSVALSIAKGMQELAEGGYFAASKEIVFTGHSQGGAVTSLLAFYLATHKQHLRIPEDCSISCITFASPRVFSKETAPFYMSKVPNTFNIINQSDIVPRVPFGAWGYKHVGTKVVIPFSLFARGVYNDIQEDLSRSIQHLDVDAGVRLAQAASTTLSPASWSAGIATCHSMEYYESIILSEFGHELVCSTQLEELQAPLLPILDQAEPLALASMPAAVRFIPSDIDESDDKVLIGNAENLTKKP